jgi:hypothetical protein
VDSAIRILSGLLLVIPMVIMASGADLMALCFNTVAVLFILQV